MIGTFGSVIFLVRDFINLEDESRTTLSAYLLKPILGMFLAIAVFIVDILGHATISSASILQIRHETLYVLALAAGLLSEQTYAVVSSRAQMALRNMQERDAGQSAV
ncbi:MAG: hypothetical protein ETSY1_39880 [Candidatus Entotheonella factor]|uniref:Uncharacterized protein n=1 Tax=Entotheonella factor TaxID=1429438 RepID=W4L613_ENTF1|nr:MAG: hypothetical protein ETSY1_39880 [Candidatus Entotheonella factor]